MTSLRARLASALSRLDVAPKTAAYHAGVSDDTVRRWLSGETRVIDAERLLRLCDALGVRDEVLGPRFFWFDHRGRILEAADLAEAAREAQRLPAVIAGDHAAAIRRNSGWISVELRGNLAGVAYHERGLAEASVRRLSDWLEVHAAAVRRRVELEEQDGTRRAATLPVELAADGIRALALAAGLARLPAPPRPSVARLRPDAAPLLPQGRRLLSLASACGPEGILAAMEGEGIMGHCSVLRLRDGVVEGIRVGSAVPLPEPNKASLIGPVRTFGDVRYGETIDHCVRETVAEGATVRRVRVSVNGYAGTYLQAAVAVPDNERTGGPAGGLYLSHTTLVEDAA